MESLRETVSSNANYILKININWGKKKKKHQLFTEHVNLSWT